MAQPGGNPKLTNGLGSTPTDRHYVTASQAQTIIQGAATNATSLKVPENIAVVDPSGLLVAFLRMDNAWAGSVDIAIKKARTAVLVNGMPSGGLYKPAQPAQALYGIERTNDGLVVFGGGFPVYLNGYLIGGVGVNGGSVPQDEDVANVSVAALKARTSVP